jgi:alkylation response protein AidB-like acyl-CoA dehydrogenase
MDALTYLCAGLVDRHAEDVMLETAISKLFCSEGLWQIADDCLQIWGGEGYMRDHGIERMLRDARINRIVEGATEVMTAFVALAGMKGVGEEFEQVLRSAKHPVGNFGRLAKFARDQWRDVVVGAHGPDLHPQLHREGHELARLTTRLARAVGRLLRTYREDILDMQLLQHRVAWSAVNLYAMAAVISKLHGMLAAQGPAGRANGNGHTNDNGHASGNGHANGGGLSPDARRDLAIGKGFCRRAAAEVRRHLRGLSRNEDADALAVADLVLGWNDEGDEGDADAGS